MKNNANPRDELSKSDPRLLKFRKKIIKHKNLDEILKQIIRSIENPRPESIMLLVGPSGVGKSTVVKAIKKHLEHIYGEHITADPGFLPYISINAVTPLDGNFNWKDNITRLLVSAGEVLIDRKVINHLEFDLDGARNTHFRSFVREELRRSLEALVKGRGVKITIVDEASALLRIKKNIDPILPFEILKSLAVSIANPILLIGAYDLLGLLDGTGQLIRRSDVIHFRRYFVGEKSTIEDVENFSDALHTLMEAIDVEKEADLTENVDYYMMKSIGCIGNLKDWLDRCCVEVFAYEGGILTRDIVKRNALPNKSLIRLTTEAKFGETKLKDVEDKELADLLKLETVPSLERKPANASESRSKKSKTKSGRIGLRGPSRDQVGGSNE